MNSSQNTSFIIYPTISAQTCTCIFTSTPVHVVHFIVYFTVCINYHMAVIKDYLNGMSKKDLTNQWFLN